MLISFFHSGYGFCPGGSNASCTCNNNATRADCQLDPPEEADLPVHVTFFLGVALMGLCIIIVYCYKKRNTKPTQYALLQQRPLDYGSTSS